MITIRVNDENYRAVKSSQLLARCKAVFGSIVEAAYIVDEYTLDSTYSSKEESDRYLKSCDKYTSSLSDATTVQFDTYRLILHFKGGNHVSFSASEWAWLSKVEVSVVSQ